MIGISVNDTTLGTTIGNLGMTDVKLPEPGLPWRHDPRDDGDRVASARASRGLTPASSSSSTAPINQDDTLVAECRRAGFMRKRPVAA